MNAYKTVYAAIAALMLCSMATFNSANADPRFDVFVDDIWEHKVLIVARINHSVIKGTIGNSDDTIGTL